MYCEKYKCTMGEQTCIARQKRHAGMGFVNYGKDPGFYQCAQGMDVMKQFDNGKGESMAEAKNAPATNPCGRVVEGKSCNYCDLVVGIDAAEKHFHKSKNNKDGFEGICKQCKAEQARSRRDAKKANKQEKLVSSKFKPEKNSRKKAAASPEAPVEEVAAPYIEWVEGPLETIEANADLDEMVKQLFTAAGYSNLLDGLKQAGFVDYRPLHLEVIFLVMCQLEERGLT